MVDERITDGRRIAQLLASELTGLERGPLAAVTVVEADPDAEPTADGTFAYAVARDGERVAEVFVHENRARIELLAGLAAAVGAAESKGLRTRPKAVDPPRALVFVESGAQVKRAVDAVVAAIE
ncbi:hypothetical protein BRC83_09580 [Halobacteriales archaeon QS_1_68_17]|nr:MAG: hypothetical protein BRC83_09580 [Halobacteriales archaeon QS_1_68_17]